MKETPLKDNNYHYYLYKSFKKRHSKEQGCESGATLNENKVLGWRLIMCQEVRKTCSCGKKDATFHLRDNVMGQEVIDRLFCPDCSTSQVFDRETMVQDRDWIIEYDMDLARMFAITKLSMDPAHVSPEFVFDEGYVTWREMYPGETEDITEERNRIIAMKDSNPREYLAAINSWAVERIQRLKDDGWRKAVRAC